MKAARHFSSKRINCVAFFTLFCFSIAMFDSIFRPGEKRRAVAVMVIVKDIRFQRNDYFIPRSVYVMYQEKDPTQRISSGSLATLADTRSISIDDTLKFHASLFENKNEPGRFLDKKRRFILRQISIIDDQEAYKDVGYFDLQVDALVQGPRGALFNFEIIDEMNLLKGHVVATVRYRFTSELSSSGGSSKQNLLRKNSSARSLGDSYFADWSDDDPDGDERKEMSEGGAVQAGSSSNSSGGRFSTMSRQISGGGYELPSLNRVNSVAPPRPAESATLGTTAPTAAAAAAPRGLQRKITNEDVTSIAFTSTGLMVDAREESAAAGKSSRYGTLHTYSSNHSMTSSTGSLNNNNNNNPGEQRQQSHSPQVGLSHAQLAERSGLSLDSLSSNGYESLSPPAAQQQQQQTPSDVIQVRRSSSANSIRSLGTAKSTTSIKSVRFDDDVIFGDSTGASSSYGGSSYNNSNNNKGAALAEEEQFGVTFDELEDFYQ